MNKLYIGNLPYEVDEAAVRQLFAEQNLTVAEISVKRGGYAFVDFPDQSAADRAIDKLHGYSFCGLPLIVEPSVANKKMVNVPNLERSSAAQLNEGSNGSPSGGWRKMSFVHYNLQVAATNLGQWFRK
ncbi:insulin-like growth factor 2 mRNA-binding protein 2 [Bombyx mandarina]|uniref:Insulin-like growth factor 2 mRNA-binding protein 2 n=1 Tax=Bombyx mandarina TaxID=7092 RepID=A0A6J2K0K8_BOMMA|nr:insulin-like growth factor 2 mRNA-binding protein 2 [Bombyx mandarina]